LVHQHNLPNETTIYPVDLTTITIKTLIENPIISIEFNTKIEENISMSNLIVNNNNDEDYSKQITKLDSVNLPIER